MGFIPPLNLGNFQPSPATLSQWIYQIWQYLQENPIATQEQLQEYIGNFITTSPETQTMIGEGVEAYLTENPPTAPVQSVQGKTGAVQLAYNEIVPASNAVPVYKASSTPATNTLVGQYNLGYRLFVNTATQEIFTISPAGALSLVGRGKIDGTTIDLNSAQGDTTISEAFNDLNTDVTENATNIAANANNIAALSRSSMTRFTLNGIQFEASRIGNVVNLTANGGSTAGELAANTNLGTIPNGYKPYLTAFVRNASALTEACWAITGAGNIVYSSGQPTLPANSYVRFSITYTTMDDPV